MATQGQIQALAGAFADVVHDWTTPKQFAEIKRRNAIYGPGVCASHDFIDANMAMEQAFRQTFGRAPDTNDDNDLAAWNEAWRIAKRGWLT